MFARAKKLFISLILIILTGFLFSGCSVLPTKKAGLQVLTANIPARIFLDGQYLEKTPFISKQLSEGNHTLLIQPDDNQHVPYETNISLKKGLLTVVTWKPGDRPETSGGVIYEMEKIDNKNISQLNLITIPDKAIISIDNQEKTFAPVLIDNLSAGHHKMSISLPSYEAQEHTINAIAGYKMLVSVKLAKLQTEEIPVQTTTPTISTNTTTLTPPASVSSQINNSTSSAQIASDSAKTIRTAIDPNQSTILIKKTNYFVSGQEGLKVRDQASLSGKEIGLAISGQHYPYLNEKQNGWYKINFHGQIGWVSQEFSTLNVKN